MMMMMAIICICVLLALADVVRMITVHRSITADLSVQLRVILEQKVRHIELPVTAASYIRPDNSVSDVCHQ